MGERYYCLVKLETVAGAEGLVSAGMGVSAGSGRWERLKERPPGGVLMLRPVLVAAPWLRAGELSSQCFKPLWED
jgi:hypothetical protein